MVLFGREVDETPTFPTSNPPHPARSLSPHTHPPLENSNSSRNRPPLTDPSFLRWRKIVLQRAFDLRKSSTTGSTSRAYSRCGDYFKIRSYFLSSTLKSSAAAREKIRNELNLSSSVKT